MRDDYYSALSGLDKEEPKLKTLTSDKWTKYKSAALPLSGRVATDGNRVRVRIADFSEENSDISIDVTVERFIEILSAAKLIGLEPTTDAIHRCNLVRDDDLT